MRVQTLVLLLVTVPLCIGVIVAGRGDAAAPAPPRSAKVNYMLHCQGCHLPDGTGMPGKVPAMRGHLARFLEVPGGREYIVQVPGVSTSKLNDADTAALMNWLVREMGPHVPTDFKPYSEREVADLRGHWLNRPQPVRASLLKAIEALPTAH